MSYLLRFLESSLWIDLAIGVLALAVRALLPRPSQRYLLLVSALFAMVAIPAMHALTGSTIAGGSGTTAHSAVEIAWAVGVLVCLFRTGRGLRAVYRLFRESVPCAGDALLAETRRISDRLGLRAAPHLRIVSDRWAPCAVGVFRSVVFMPASLVAGLSPQQMSAILAHEIAHIRRHDFLVNLAQSVIEALLFFHPAVWLISHLSRVERELCCDDIVVSGFGQGREYATALAVAARLSSASMAPGAAAVGLPFRVSRLIGRRRSAPLSMPRSFAGACALCLALIPALVMFGSRPWSVSLPREELPASWSAVTTARTQDDLIEIRLRTPSGAGKIVLTRPTPSQPTTWFQVDGVSFDGRRDSTGNVAFSRRR